LQRWVYYDAVYEAKGGASSAILAAYALFEFFGCVRIALINEFKRVSDKTSVKLADDDDDVDYAVGQVLKAELGNKYVELATTSNNEGKGEETTKK